MRYLLSACVIGLVLAGEGHLADAAVQLEKAVQLAPSDPAALTALGMVQKKLGKPDEAIKCFDR